MNRLRIEDMPLQSFRYSGLRIVIKSELLGTEIVFAADNAPVVGETEERVVYQVRELEELLQSSSSAIRVAHQVKEIFGGRVLSKTEVRNREQEAMRRQLGCRPPKRPWTWRR